MLHEVLLRTRSAEDVPRSTGKDKNTSDLMLRPVLLQLLGPRRPHPQLTTLLLLDECEVWEGEDEEEMFRSRIAGFSDLRYRRN